MGWGLSGPGRLSDSQFATLRHNGDCGGVATSIAADTAGAAVGGAIAGYTDGIILTVNTLSFGYAFEEEAERIRAENAGDIYYTIAGVSQVVGREALIMAITMGLGNAAANGSRLAWYANALLNGAQVGYGSYMVGGGVYQVSQGNYATGAAMIGGGALMAAGGFAGAAAMGNLPSRTTVIGRMKDLERFAADSHFDTWAKSGPSPLPGRTNVTWAQNEQWLAERVARGDRFALATDPSTLPKVLGGYIPGQPNGYFTAREIQWLTDRGINIIPMY